MIVTLLCVDDARLLSKEKKERKTSVSKETDVNEVYVRSSSNVYSLNQEQAYKDF